jgi:hypothetical protein
MNNWLAAAAAGALAFVGGFGGHGDKSSTTRPFDMGMQQKEMRDGRGSSTKPFEKGDRERTASSTKAQLDMSCVSAAVATREAALGTAMTTYSASVNAAYATRASALAAAYASTDTTTVKNSVKTAWANFKGAMTAAKKGWQSSKEGAWNAFKTAIKSCGSAAASVADISNQGTEASGQ